METNLQQATGQGTSMFARNWGIGWVLALVGFPLGGLLILLLIGKIETPVQGALGGVIAGLVAGAAQWLPLRRRLPVAPLWIPAMAVGMGLGVGLSTALFGAETTPIAILMRAPLPGLLIGLGQMIVLRRELRGAFIWPVVTTLAYMAAWLITAQVIGDHRNQGFIVFGSSGALAYQVLTGLVLWRLMRCA